MNAKMKTGDTFSLTAADLVDALEDHEFVVSLPASGQRVTVRVTGEIAVGDRMEVKVVKA